jgi:DNA-binding PadR family transcriptional regulator
MSRPRSPLWLVVLATVFEEPMHPYRMQALIKARGKDQIANVAQRNSVYQAIEGLRRAGLIEVRETARDARRPEKTVYGITAEGRRTLQAWMRTMLASPAREFPEMPAALSFVMLLPPAQVRDALKARAAHLEHRLQSLETPVPGLPRLFLLETEYMTALLRAELVWLKGVIADLEAGRLTWSEAWLRRIAKEMARHTTAAELATRRSAPRSQRMRPPRRR